MNDTGNSIRHHAAAPPVAVPVGHIGPVALPGTNRHIWWTGRVAIGLRYEGQQRQGPVGESAAWVQDLMLAGRNRQPEGAPGR